MQLHAHNDDLVRAGKSDVTSKQVGCRAPLWWKINGQRYTTVLRSHNLRVDISQFLQIQFHPA